MRAAALTLAVALAGCATPARWSPVREPGSLEGVAAPGGVVGLGLRHGPGGPVARACLAAGAARTAPGRPGVEVGPSPGDPRSVTASARAPGVRTWLDEAAATLVPEAAEVLARDGPGAFLALCGTEVVVSAGFEPSAVLVARLDGAPPPEPLARLRELGAAPGEDWLRLTILDRLAPDGPRGITVELDTGRPSAPLPAPVAAVSRHVLGLAGALSTEGRGRRVTAETRPWSAVLPAEALAPPPGATRAPEGAREAVSRAVEELTEGIRTLERRARQAARLRGAAAAECARLTGALAPELAGSAACAASAREQLVPELVLLPSCAGPVGALARLETSAACREVAAAAEELADPLLRDTTHSPLLLAAGERRTWLPAPGRSPGRPARAGGPARGDGTDRRGRTRFARCALEGEASPAALIRIAAQAVRDDDRRLTALQRALPFLRPPPRPGWTGAIELLVAQPPLLPVLRLTPEAERLARRDLRGFLARCGTHYVAQAVVRRGITFSSRPGDADELDVVPYGLSTPDPRLEPRTPPARFFERQGELVTALAEGTGGIPEALALEPWLELLRVRGLAGPDG